MTGEELQKRMAITLRGREGTVQAVEPNGPGHALARILRGTKDVLNYPGKVLGVGAGDLIMGEAPEYVDDMSHGFSKARGTGMTYTPDPRLLDVGFLPVLGGGLAKVGKSAFSRLLRTTGEETTDMSRREFLKKSGAIAGSGAVASTGLPAAEKMVAALAKNVAPEAALQTAKSVVPAFVTGAKEFANPENLANILKHWGTYELPEEAGETFIEGTKWIAKQLHKELDSPEMIKILEGSVGKYTPKEGLFEDILRHDYSQAYRRGIADEVAGGSASNFDKIMAGEAKALEWVKANPKNAELASEYLITGKLPKGTTAEIMEHVSWNTIKDTDTAAARLSNKLQRAMGGY